MQLITSPQEFKPLAENYHGTCVTIGNFDGVHVGHQSLLKRTVEKAAQYNLMPMMVTFWPHPRAVLANVHAPSLVTPQAKRLQYFAKHGINLTLEMPFTRELALLSPEEFIKVVLVPLCCKKLIIGYDFSLGKNRAGNFEILQELGLKYGFEIEQLPPVIKLDAVVSSTRIRDLLKTGAVWDVQTLLGRYYAIEGEVIRGFGRGKDLGFPTANLQTEYDILPRQGVYATWVSGLGTKAVPAVSNIGYAPTFANKELSVETFLLSGEHDIYGKQIDLHFVQHIRDEQRFNNIDELKTRIAKDVEVATNILSAAPNP